MSKFISRIKSTTIYWLIALMLPSVLFAQAGPANEVIVVPYSQLNPRIPHPAHEGAPITLKAIIRNTTCDSYQIRWDVNRNGNYADDFVFTSNRNATTMSDYDIGRTFIVPSVPQDQSFNISVQVTPNCSGQAVQEATFLLYVYDFTPSPNPVNWTADQLEIMTSMAIQESLWYVHRSMTNYSGRDVNSISASAGYPDTTAINQWLFVINNHLPAYPPNTLQGVSPDGWLRANDLRWNKDPYAESAMRLLNYAVRNTVRVTGLPSADEANTCGYQGNVAITNCSVDRNSSTSIPAADDGMGYYLQGNNLIYLTGMNLGGLTPNLRVLNGTTVQVGSEKGVPWNYFVQQMVDYLGYQQIDGGCAKGGWLYYDSYDNVGCGYSDLSSTQWAYIGLDSAESAGTPYGVFVNNRHKYRVADNALNNQRADGGGAYRSSEAHSDFKLTGGQVLATRWLGMHNMNPASAAVLFPNDTGLTAGQMRALYDRYMSYVEYWFPRRKVQGSEWQDGLWQNGDYLCGNTNAVYNGGRCGNSYAIYSHQKGYRTGTPNLETIGSIDWYRRFSIYYVRAQDRIANANDPLASYNVFGRVIDEYCEVHSVTCVYGPGQMSAIMGGLVMTPALFNPKPVASGSVSPLQVTEGCFSGTTGNKVSTNHQTSFHPNADASIVSYYWDMNQADGLWWQTGANPDTDVNGNIMRTADRLKVFDYTYRNRGTYVPTLRVEDNNGLFKEAIMPSITVNPAANVAPSVATGGPYIIEVGQNLQLNATATDGNLNCGDVLRVSWNLNPAVDNIFEISGEKTLVTWNAATLGALPRNVANTIQVKVLDSANLTSTQPTQIYVYDTNPIAVASVNPAQAACRQNVTFDSAGSRHPNTQQRIIVSYDWAVDGQVGAGQTFSTSFNTFGVKTAQLTVTDDLGRTGQTTVAVNINQGNLPPVIRVPSVQVTIRSNEQLALDARLSTDPNEDCGDRIAAYEWHFNGDNVADFVGNQVTVPVAAWQQFMGYPNNKTMNIRAKLIDSLGASTEQVISITAIPAEPIPSISQNPNPSPYRLDNGRSSTFLSGLESKSLIPNTSITRYEWDIACNGTYEYEGGQVLYENTFPPNTPIGQINANPVTVCLRITDSNGTIAVSAPYTIQYQVSGNTAPTADADPTDPPEKEYHLVTGENLVLDGSKSFDPDTAQGFNDFINQYKWSVNQRNDPSFTKNAVNANDNQAKTLSLTPAQMASYGINDIETPYPISLEVRDTSNNKSSDTSKVTIHKKGATLGVLINPPSTSPGARVTFDASQTRHTHPDYQLTKFIWLFGDLVYKNVACVTDANCNGNGYCINHPVKRTLECIDGSLGSAVGSVVNFTFNQMTPPGTPAIPVTLIVKDDRGGMAQSGYGDDVNNTYSIRVDQGNRPPVSNPGGGTNLTGQVVGPYTLLNHPTESIVFNGSGSSDPDSVYGDRIVEYAWTVGTCNFVDVNASLPRKTMADLSACGISGISTSVIRLRVKDRFGTTAESTVNLNIVAPPVASGSASPNRASCQQSVNFDGRASTFSGPADQGFNITKYSWDINGDNVEDSSQASFTTPVSALPNNGQAIVNAKLTITDALGVASLLNGQAANAHQQFTIVPVTIDVQNLPPVANAGGPYVTGPTILNGQPSFAPVTLDARRSSDPNAPCDQIVRYAWDTDGDGLFGRADTSGPTTINGSSSDYEGAQVTFVKSTWRVGTVDTVRLQVLDAYGVWSAISDAQIEISSEVPPTGNIVSPRANSCVSKVGGNQSSATIEVFHLDNPPKAVNVKLTIGGVQVGLATVQANAFDANKKATINVPIDLTLVAEGQNELVAEYALVSNPIIRTDSNSGGRVTFDYTAPLLTLGATPSLNTCYANGNVPDATYTVMDNFDLTPQVTQVTTENGCVRTLKVSATDVCGNKRDVTRDYLVAQTVTANIAGVTEGALLASTRITWTIPGSPLCAPNVTATLKKDAAMAAAYASNTNINTSGSYAFTLNVRNCLGISSLQVVNFAINKSPVAVSIPSGHPNSDPNNAGSYIVNEGSTLILDGSASTPPEAIDTITAYEWDVGRDNTIDFRGPTYNFDTSVNGVKLVKLTVKDSLSASNSKDFQVTVNDITPIADGGGPYGGTQGQVLTFNASRSRSLAPAADAITRYVWNWGDGTPPSEGVEVTHAFAAQGAYNVTLTVFDEDNSSSVVVGAIISDVDPQIRGAQIVAVQGANVAPTFPVTGPEILPLSFKVDAAAGTPTDPITSYQWDFDGDNVFEKTTATDTTDFQFKEPGTYQVGVIVRDRDSFSKYILPVTVQPVSWQTLLEHAKYQVNLVKTNTPNLAPFARLKINAIPIDLDKAIWGQKYDGIDDQPIDEFPNSPLPARARAQHLMHQGVSSVATQSVLQKLIAVQNMGIDFGLVIWSLGRQLVRESSYDLEAIKRDREGVLSVRLTDPKYLERLSLAEDRLNAAKAIYNDPNFERDAKLLNQSQGLSAELELTNRESFDWMTLSVDYCNAPEFLDFTVNQRYANDPNKLVDYSSDAEETRARIYNAISNMQTEMENYASRGTEAEPAPGSTEILDAIASFNEILVRAQKKINAGCAAENPNNIQNACSNDRNALEIELEIMQLISMLQAAAVNGAYVLPWQSCLVQFVKFRIEVSLQKVLYQCSINNPLTLQAFDSYESGLDMYQNNDILGVLSYYSDPEQRCLMVDIYNRCLVTNDSSLMIYPYPDICLQ